MPTRDQLVEQKYITARRHPTEPLTIYNYTARTQIEGAWNEHTRMCRGLIEHDDGRIIARPYSKFFNFGEPHAEMPAAFRVADKLDGSLGITYRGSDGNIRIATRGAFMSEQAQHATMVWQTRYAHVVVPEGQTWLFEIVYPANRIVVNYGALDDLILHGAIDNATGADLPLPTTWPGPVVETFAPRALDELRTVVKPNAEGFVLVEDPAPADRPAIRIKVKLDEYVRIHKLVAGITPKRLWECLSRGDDIMAMIEGAPDEVHRGALATANAMRADVRDIVASARDKFAAIRDELGAADRKAFAMRIQQEPHHDQGMLFAMLSGKPPEKIAWKIVEPSSGDEVSDEA